MQQYKKLNKLQEQVFLHRDYGKKDQLQRKYPFMDSKRLRQEHNLFCSNKPENESVYLDDKKINRKKAF